MKSRKKSTTSAPNPPLPPDWDESAGLRETYLRHFPQPEDAAALRRHMAMLHEYALEHARFWPDPGESPVRAELRATLADLRHSRGSLHHLGRERELSSLSPVDDALVAYVGKHAPELDHLIELLAKALG